MEVEIFKPLALKLSGCLPLADISHAWRYTHERQVFTYHDFKGSLVDVEVKNSGQEWDHRPNL